MKYYHGSKTDNIKKLKGVVGEFDNNGGIFISTSLRFAKSWGKYIYEVELLTNNIFDYDNKEHREKYSNSIYIDYDLSKLNLAQDDVYKLLFEHVDYKTLYSKAEPEKYKKEYDCFFKNKLKGKVRARDEFNEPIDYWKTPDQYAIEMLNKYPTKKIDIIEHLIRAKRLFKDYLSIEKNDSTISKLGFEGAYIWEGGAKNIQVYNPDNIRIIGKINERIIRFNNF